MMQICSLGETIGVSVTSGELHKLGDAHPKLLVGMAWILRSCKNRQRTLVLPAETFRTCMENLELELKTEAPMIGGLRTSHQLSRAMDVDYVKSLLADTPPDIGSSTQ